MRKNNLNYLLLAFRNIGRHKVKTILTVAAITIGITLFIYMDAFLLGMDIDSKRNLVNYEIGAAKIYSQAYFEKKDEIPSYESFTNYQPIIKKLNEVGYNTAIHFVFTGILFSAERDSPFMFIGIDPVMETTLFRYNNFVEKGEFIKDNEQKIMLGAIGAKNLNVKVGDTVRLSTTIDRRNERGIITHTNQLIDLKVGAIINTPNPKTNGNIGYLPLSILQDETGLMLGGHITEICIRNKDAKDYDLPSDNESPDVIKKALGDKLPNELVLVDWQEDAKDFLAISTSKRGGASIVLFLLIIITILGISNTMLMAIIERTKEIGMMRALGMTNSEIVILFIVEGGLIGAIGSGLGIIFGCIINIFMVNYGIDFSQMMNSMGNMDLGYRVVSQFKSAWNTSSIITAGFLGVLVSMLSAIIPARRSVKKSVSDDLRFE
ncbi:MAG: hypothetical protein A2086_08005 [Spirochaetes bacterium GWD1_27_9]|nr:MAG: hypothetical protein A2Z98_07135 [Spirochaetes bacterium GWB1_27_13]OHD25157.1 MAG: hypothetical protein A2Y34_16855 [Spirochaetes bacterium GWC1_27_15]OHD34465.1 MAG: hypothetical protein A2086_08005 [Spirochaetes bacterium GWD1_27_9]